MQEQREYPRLQKARTSVHWKVQDYSVAQIEELAEELNRITDERSRINRNLDMIRREQLGEKSSYEENG